MDPCKGSYAISAGLVISSDIPTKASHNLSDLVLAVSVAMTLHFANLSSFPEVKYGKAVTAA